MQHMHLRSLQCVCVSVLGTHICGVGGTRTPHCTLHTAYCTHDVTQLRRDLCSVLLRLCSLCVRMYMHVRVSRAGAADERTLHAYTIYPT